tara:strand:+ start:19 stop:918 length:900 start_codon:yes stop_codon:yes gene_type:complete
LQFHKDELIIYTVLIGSNQLINSQPFIKNSKYRHVCLTDNKKLTSKDWEIIIVDPVFPQDSNRSQRLLKLKPNIIFPEYKYSLYLDNTIVFKVKPDDFLDQITKDKTPKDNEPFILVPFHSYRRDLLSEFKICSKYDLANQFKIYEQLKHYFLTNKKILKMRPYWCGILLRNHNHEKIINHSEIWFSHLCRYTRRDQLSILHTAFQANIIINGFDLDNKKSKFHNWPIELRKRNRKYEEHSLDLLPSRFAEKTEKLIYKIQKNKKEKFIFFSPLKFIKFLIYKVRFFLRYILYTLINFL